MVIYERHVVPRAERKIYELEQEIKALKEQIDYYCAQNIAANKMIDVLRKQIQEQEHENDILVRTNQYLEYHITDYF